VARVDHFPAGHIDPEKLIDSCAYFAKGGTKFDPALQEAFGLIDKGPQGAYKKADVILITDGQGLMPPESTLKLKKVTGAVLYGICIGSDSQVLKDISDSYTAIQDLAEDGEVKEKIFSV